MMLMKHSTAPAQSSDLALKFPSVVELTRIVLACHLSPADCLLFASPIFLPDRHLLQLGSLLYSFDTLRTSSRSSALSSRFGLIGCSSEHHGPRRFVFGLMTNGSLFVHFQRRYDTGVSHWRPCNKSCQQSHANVAKIRCNKTPEARSDHDRHAHVDVLSAARIIASCQRIDDTVEEMYMVRHRRRLLLT